MKSTVIKMLIFIICMIGVIVLFTFADDLLPSDVAEYSFNQESEYKDAFTFEPEELLSDVEQTLQNVGIDLRATMNEFT